MTLQLLYEFNLCWLWGVHCIFQRFLIRPCLRSWNLLFRWIMRPFVIVIVFLLIGSWTVSVCVSVMLCHLFSVSVYLDKLLKYWYQYFREHGLNTPPTLPAITQSKQTKDSKEQSNSHGPSLPRTFVHCNTYDTYFLSRKFFKKPSSNSCSSRADINEYYLLVPLVLQNYQSKFCTNPIFL